METIILDGKEYKKLARVSKNSKKMIFHNENNEILVYENNLSFSLPTVMTSSENDFISQIQELTNISFESDKMNCFLQFLKYVKLLERVNNKLNEVYIKTIKDYYHCMIDMEKGLENKIEPINRLEELWEPKVMNIDEILSIYKYSKKKHYSETEEALKKFKQKVLIK